MMIKRLDTEGSDGKETVTVEFLKSIWLTIHNPGVDPSSVTLTPTEARQIAKWLKKAAKKKEADTHVRL